MVAKKGTYFKKFISSRSKSLEKLFCRYFIEQKTRLVLEKFHS